jgi:DNA repair exonuclease SbcCD nuclease subunit
MTLRFLHCADLHLDSPLRGLERYDGAPVDAFRNATRGAFANIAELAIERGVDFVVIAGDVFDGDWIDFNTGLFFANELRRLGDAGIRSFVVRGNHDAVTKITRSLPDLDAVRVFGANEPETIVDEQLGVAVHGQSFATEAVTADLAARYPAKHVGLLNVGVLHTALAGREGHQPYAPTTEQRLADKGYDYWALGHVHARETVREAPWIVFPGNSQGRHGRELGPKGCVVVDAEAGVGVSSVEFVATDVARWEHASVDATDVATMGDLHDAVQARVRDSMIGLDGRPLALRLTIAGVTSLHAALAADAEQARAELRALVNEASRGQAWLEKVRVGVAAPLDLAALAERDDPVGALVRALDALSSDPTALADLAREPLADLAQKLPKELVDLDASLRLDGPEGLAGALEGARHRLLAAIAEEAQR